MKLNTIMENNNDFVVNEKNVEEYLANLDVPYKDRFVIENDGSVRLFNSLNISYTKSPKESILPFKIKSTTHNVKYFLSELDKNFSQMEICNTLYIDECNITSNDFVIKTFANELNIEDSNFVNGITFDNNYDGMLLNNIIVYIKILKTNVKNIKYKSNHDNVHFEIVVCEEIKSFYDLDLGENIRSLELRRVGIKNFKGFNTNIKRYLYVDSETLENYLLTDLINTKSFYVYLYNSFNNIITILLNRFCDLIEVNIGNTNHDTKKVSDIMNKYVTLPNNTRHEQVMDCAIDLIDAGFEEAAEL